MDEGICWRMGGMEKGWVTTMFGQEVPADHCCSAAAQSLYSCRTQVHPVLCAISDHRFNIVVFSLTPTSFILVMPHIFLEVLVFCLRLTQMTFQLCGNHRHNCQWWSSIYRCLFSRLIMHSVRLNLSEYAVDKCCPMQIQEKVWWPKGVPLSCLFLQLD